MSKLEQIQKSLGIQVLKADDKLDAPEPVSKYAFLDHNIYQAFRPIYETNRVQPTEPDYQQLVCYARRDLPNAVDNPPPLEPVPPVSDRRIVEREGLDYEVELGRIADEMRTHYTMRADRVRVPEPETIPGRSTYTISFNANGPGSIEITPAEVPYHGTGGG